LASVSAPGTGSGIDVGGLVSQLIAAESQPVTARLDAQEAEFNGQFSGLSQIKSRLESFAANLDSLKLASTFQTRTSTVGDDTLLSVTADASAPIGKFSIEVDRLAAAQKLQSAGFSSATASIGSGTLVIAGAGPSFSVTVPSSATTLSDVRDAINNASGNPGVSATLVTVDASGGGTETRLAITAAETGTSNALTITAIDADGNNTDTSGLSGLVYDPSGSGTTNLTQTVPAADAQIQVDGQTLTSQTNSITVAISGVTLDLLKASPGTSTDVTVAVNSAAVSSAVSSFVSSYNTLRGTINDLTAFDPVAGQGAVLLGDSGVRGISAGLQRELGNIVSGIESQFTSLAELGLKTNTNGTLTLDQSKLDAAIASDLAGVEQLFTSTNGIATRLSSFTDEYTKSQGTLDERNDAILARLGDIALQRESLERRMSAREESLLAKFAAMDSILAQMQSTSSFLTQQLNATAALSSGSSKS